MDSILHHIGGVHEIGAGSSRSGIARLLGHARGRGDRLLALSLLTDRTRNQHLLEVEAVEDGWWYFASAGSDSIQICLITTAGPLRVSGSPSAALRAAARRSRLAMTLVTDSFLEDVCVEAIDCGALDLAAGALFVAVGDAASTYDPIASVGL